MMGARWPVLWAVLRSELTQIVRQKGFKLLLGLFVFTGVSLAVTSARIEPVALLSLEAGEDGETPEAPESKVLCTTDALPIVSVEGVLPAYVNVPWTAVAPGAATAEVGIRYAPGGPGQGDWDGRLTIWTEDAGADKQRDDVYECLRRDLHVERDRRLESHGFTHRESHVLRIQTHAVGEVKDSSKQGILRGRWRSPDLPSGLDFFEVFAALIAFAYLSNLVVDSVARNQVSGWHETLGVAGLHPGERVLAQLAGLWAVALGMMGIVCLGGLLAGPFVGWFVHPGRVLCAALTPIGSAVVLLGAVRSARDVRAVTVRSIGPLVLLMYAIGAGVVLDLQWMPLGGPLLLAVFGGTPQEWVTGVGVTVAFIAVSTGWVVLRAQKVTANHGDHDPARARHAMGRYGREAWILAFLALWAQWLLPPVAGSDVVAATLVMQVVGLGGVALCAPVVLGLPIRTTLGLRRPGRSSWLGAVLMPVATVPTSLLLFHYQRQYTNIHKWGADFLEAAMESLTQLMEAYGGVLVWSVPGVFEELFFRGALLGLLLPRGTRPVRRSRVVFAVVMQGLAFGLFHLPPERWMATGMVGVLYGVMAVRSRSVWPGVVAHMLHNFLLVQLSSHYGDAPVEPALWMASLVLLVVPALLLVRADPSDGTQTAGDRSSAGF